MDAPAQPRRPMPATAPTDSPAIADRLSPDAIRARNNVHVYGRGRQPMLFAHGFGCDQAMWRYVAPAFADDYRIVLFDYVGSGKSDWSAYNSRRYGTLEGY